MRVLVLAIVVLGAAYAATPARAQTYDPAYPVCLQVYQAAWSTIISSAPIRRWRSARPRRRDARRHAWSIRIIRPRGKPACAGSRVIIIEDAPPLPPLPLAGRGLG